MTVEKNLDNIHDSVSETGLQCEHLTTRQDVDVLNIKRQYNTEGTERHANDHTSAARMVRENEMYGL